MVKRWFIVLLLLAALPVLPGDYFCKRYDIKVGEILKLDATAGDITVHDIKFEFPSYVGPKKLAIKGRNQAVINLKNYGKHAVRVRIALALFDESGNLVGCGTTGNKMGATRSGETESFFVAFDWVNEHLSTAEVFYLTVETDPLS